MISKHFEIGKFKEKTNFFLFYGENEGLKLETIETHFKNFNKKNTHRYTEKEIIANKEIFFESIYSKSFFENEKLILISDVTDKTLNIIEEVIETKFEDEVFILLAKRLEKKSKIRNFFEKDERTLTIPFYEDTSQTLVTIARKILNENKIDLSQENLNDLVNSIKERGVIQPIIVRRSNMDNSKYEIIAGERRWLAAQKAGLHEIPVVVTDADDLKSLEFAIVENVQRHDLNPLEEAQGYKRLIDEFAYDQDKVSKFIGKSRSYISNSLRLLNLPKEVLDFVEQKKITAGHAKILVGLDNAVFLANKFIEKKLSVRQAENLVKIFRKTKRNTSSKVDSNIRELENSISEKIGLSVSIKNNKNNKGTISFYYKELEQLNKIIDIIKSGY